MPGATPCLSASSAAVVSAVLSCPTTDLQDRDSLRGCPGAIDGAFAACAAAQGSAGRLETALQKPACAHYHCDQQTPFCKTICLLKPHHTSLKSASWNGYCHIKMVY